MLVRDAFGEEFPYVTNSKCRTAFYRVYVEVLGEPGDM